MLERPSSPRLTAYNSDFPKTKDSCEVILRSNRWRISNSLAGPFNVEALALVRLHQPGGRIYGLPFG
ncbi:MAG: hypothetical protein VYA69_15350, partial [Gemmatimonadota bacterium]|nr:hypothetical protein [Gemmatimonadota bacterium]